MSGHLIEAGDGPPTPCRLCGAPAAGPCARCRAPVCPDCCTLTDGGVNTFAVCTGCAGRGGASLGRAWLGLLGWIGLVLVGLAAVAILLARLRS